MEGAAARVEKWKAEISSSASRDGKFGQALSAACQEPGKVLHIVATDAAPVQPARPQPGRGPRFHRPPAASRPPAGPNPGFHRAFHERGLRRRAICGWVRPPLHLDQLPARRGARFARAAARQYRHPGRFRAAPFSDRALEGRHHFQTGVRPAGTGESEFSPMERRWRRA